MSGSTITITAPGTYVVSGTLNDGQIVVDSDDRGTVRLVLNGADITCSTSAPIYVKNADKTIITLADGTENRVTDGYLPTPSTTTDQTSPTRPSSARTTSPSTARAR